MCYLAAYNVHFSKAVCTWSYTFLLFFLFYFVLFYFVFSSFYLVLFFSSHFLSPTPIFYPSWGADVTRKVCTRLLFLLHLLLSCKDFTYIASDCSGHVWGNRNKRRRKRKKEKQKKEKRPWLFLELNSPIKERMEAAIPLHTIFICRQPFITRFWVISSGNNRLRQNRNSPIAFPQTPSVLATLQHKATCGKRYANTIGSNM